MSQVEAVIVAGGFGTRLLPLTARHPKHLLNVGGVPFLEHQIVRLARLGVGHIVLATSYHADRFQPVLGDGSRWGVSLDYVQELEPLGTGGAIRNVADVLGNDPGGAVVILNGDILSGHDLRAQLADFDVARQGREVDVSLHLVEVADARPFGSVPTDAHGRVLGFVEKSGTPVTNRVNAGCYIFRRRVVDTIPEGRVVSVERETFPDLVEAGSLVMAFVDNAYWRDVGTPDALVAASKDLVLGVASSPAMETGPADARLDATAQVAPSATVNGGSLVAERVRVGARALVSGTVLMADASVGADAVVVDSVVGPGASIGARAELRAVAVGDEAQISPDGRLENERVPCGGDAS
ncbi:MAG: NDP-sugar synthase [Actinomycetota bacterium]|nr:NDP-sugar synthase [Actinomycetota bacterium]